jgi:AAHS family 4-hydroxybenzoate transporter-like MFS transporter
MAVDGLPGSPIDQTVLDVQEFIDRRPMGGAQWLILVLCFLAMAADGFHTSAMAFVAPALTLGLGISKLALGPILSAALIGLGIGALVAGPLADKSGRKRVLIASVLVCAVGSMLSASARSEGALLAWRFLTGLGIGAAMPNCTTLAAEFVPSRRRAMLSNMMFCGFPLGASSGGFLAAWLIPHFGWRSVFMVGGAAPLVLVAVLTRLPESISFMAVRKWPAQKIRAALYWIAGDDADADARIAAATGFRIAEKAPAGGKSPLKVILAPQYLTSTLMLWVTYFMGLVLFYLLTSWMPTLVRDAGYSVSRAAVATALFPLGGAIGAVCCGWLMDRMNATRVVGGAYFLTGILLLVLARSTHALGALMSATFLAGIAMNGAQSSMPVLAASTYPTAGRASGVSWMLGAGRMGAVVGAFGGGILMQAGYSMAEIIAMLAVVAMLAAAALAAKDYASRKTSRINPVAE